MNLFVPTLLVTVLAGLGLYGVLARRNAVMVLIGTELMINAGVLLLVLTDVRLAALGASSGNRRLLTGQVGALFAITVAAAEIGVALAVILLHFRTRGTSDLVVAADNADDADDVANSDDVDEPVGSSAGGQVS